MVQPDSLGNLNNSKTQSAPSDLQTVNAQLLELDELKTTFIALVSHELRTPATVVIGYLQTGIEELSADVPPATRQHFEIALEQAKNLARIIQELTDFARLQQAHPVALIDPLPLGEALIQVFTMLRPALESKSLKPSLSLSPDLWKQRYDGESLIMIFRNLLSNSAKFTPARGRVWVTGAHLPAQKAVAISVNDTAPPIPEEKRVAIFQDFRQLENYLTRRYEGLGLGLAIARRAARALGGEITLDVRPDGNTFTVTLPEVSKQ
jgi:signal transduction histidine kinase